MSTILLDNDIHIVSLADNQFAQHLGVAFASLLVNMPSDTGVRLYVISTGFTEENQFKLKKTVERPGVHIQFIVVDGTPYEGFGSMGGNNRTTYLRLAIPDVIPSSIPKILCLDSDIVVTGNIVELWETDLQGRAIAAVSDQWAASQCKILQIPEGIYFNAGVMVMDLTKWRKESISLTVMNYITTNTHILKFHEQDALNALLYKDWIRLPDKWNSHTTIVNEWNDAIPPAVIHYTGLSKPWHFDNIHPFKNEYYKYLRLTEWKSYKPEINLSRIMKRIARPLLPVLQKVLPQPAFTLLLKYKSRLLN
ncbi:glycosyltransferase family 8 protein [Cohnella terricola]|uniref:Glycosyltransferase family 8 protein n=1 Tax=Cohnella terricola TaxID=1289167 RepID=A0A559JMN1_9BACL|nr:glycosyltransferase family 8 protein [Cohnella terricola]TVY01120.1 glycosyltransferase family 8 protein [Cohnella terricola]